MGYVPVAAVPNDHKSSGLEQTPFIISSSGGSRVWEEWLGTLRRVSQDPRQGSVYPGPYPEALRENPLPGSFILLTEFILFSPFPLGL